MDARRAAPLLMCLAVATAGCMQAARVFLDIPEGSPAAAARPSPTLVDSFGVVRAAPLPPPEIESVVDLDSVLALLPSTRSGGVDWVAAWRDGVIRPRASIGLAEPDTMGRFAYDLYLAGGGGPEAYFPHSTHQEWLTCESCHPGVYRGGAQSFLPEAAHETTSCAYCHGTVAFSIQACEQCHEIAEDLPSNRQVKAFAEVTVLERSEVADSTGDPARIGAGFELTGLYPPASFPHDVHRLRYQCRACHENPFPMERGATVMTQEGAHSSDGCGRCHDGVVAFGAELDSCDQCHVAAGG